MNSSTARIHFRSLGCKVNLADAAAVVDRLPPGIMELAESPAEADLVVLNTCVVTHKAERDIRKILGALKRDHPDLPVVITGCAANLRRNELSGHQNVQAVVPPGSPEAVARQICECLGVDSRREGSPTQSPFARLHRHRAFLKVQDGCNSHCAYCIVPQVRGQERSIPVDEVIRQVKLFCESGHREVVLSGIHLGRFGLPGSDTLAGLIRALAPVFDRLGPGFRIRLSSVEPLEWSGELIDAVARHPFVCAHFHIPLQSGDDRVLAGMGRPYRSEQFTQVITELHRRLPEAALGSDVLVGFPGESEEAAANTLRLIRALPLSYLHVFTFSARPGTRAFDMPDPVDPQRIRARAAQVRSAGDKLWREFLARGVGQSHQVLIEKATSQGCQGHTQSYRPFRLTGGPHQPGQLVEAVADGVQDLTLVGTAARAL